MKKINKRIIWFEKLKKKKKTESLISKYVEQTKWKWQKIIIVCSTELKLLTCWQGLKDLS